MIMSNFILIGFVILLVLVGVLCWLLYAAKKVSAMSESGPVYKVPGQPAAPAPAVQSGISGEVVAAISAAVAAIMDEQAPGQGYAIASIQRARTSRPAWSLAAMQQNTRPF